MALDLDLTNPVILATDATKQIDSFYGYIPTEWICIIFLVLFSLSCLIHLGQAIFFRTYWLIPTACFCGILEILGWSARLWSSFSPSLPKPYEMQITCTILGPTPLIAANFVILGQVIELLGTSYSRLSPRMYSIIFLTCDVISLVVQGVGGGMAAVAVQTKKSPVKGGHIMLGGIAFQLTVISVYALSGSEFFARYFQDKPVRRSSSSTTLNEKHTARRRFDDRLQFQMIGLIFMTVCLWIRSVYRTIELADGWTGRIITTQVYFNVLDGAMVTLAMFTLNFAHPGFLLTPPGPDASVIKLEQKGFDS